MRFGPDINAYTSFDETVYMLQLPSDSLDILKKGFQVLEDWAHNISFENEEIDRERGVILEEWRLRRGANARMQDEQFPILFHDSRYAERLPIGKTEIIESFTYDVLKRYYADWYRPGLMAVIAVGDFDVDFIQNLIKEHFENLKAKKDTRERKEFPIPDHDETLFAIASDPEARFSSVSLYVKINMQEDFTEQDYRQTIMEQLYISMINQRLTELTQKEDPPFLAGFAGTSRFVATRGFFTLSAIVNENGIIRGFEALLTEVERVRRHGFNTTELEREKSSVMRSLEQALKEYDKTKSSTYASEYIRAFLYHEPIPGLPFEYELYKKYIDGIGLEEINNLTDKWMREESRVVMVNYPEKEGIEEPEKSELKKLLEKTTQLDIAAYQDNVSTEPLVSIPEVSSPVSKEKYNEVTGHYEWKLNNGIKVVLKPTDFKNDQILFSATSYGGLSLIETEKLLSAENAGGIINSSGVANYNLIQLNKFLSDKVANVRPYISEISEGFSGSCSPADFETMLKLIYAYFTEPRLDKESISSYFKRLEAIYKNRQNSPESAFQDTLTYVLTQNHPRYQPMTIEKIEEINPQTAFEIYKSRFADGDDFTFFFVGNFQPDSIQPLIEKYLGAIPVLEGKEAWKDNSYTYPDGIIKKNVYKGIEEKSRVSINFIGDFKWSVEERSIASALTEIMRIKLRERLREDKGGTYNVGVAGRFSHWPRERYRISVSFGCNPENTMDLINEVFTQIDSLRNNGTTKEYLNKIKEIRRRSNEINMRENGYWLNQLEFAYFHNLDPAFIIEADKRTENLSLDDIQQAARKYLNPKNYVEVVLYPEKENVSN